MAVLFAIVAINIIIKICTEVANERPRWLSATSFLGSRIYWKLREPILKLFKPYRRAGRATSCGGHSFSPWAYDTVSMQYISWFYFTAVSGSARSRLFRFRIHGWLLEPGALWYGALVEPLNLPSGQIYVMDHVMIWWGLAFIDAVIKCCE